MTDDAPKLHRWIDRDGQEWACAVYDHGPPCRFCQRVDVTTRVILQLVDDGDAILVAPDSDGSLRFSLTEQGIVHARDVLLGLGADPDDKDSVRDAIRRDIAKDN